RACTAFASTISGESSSDGPRMDPTTWTSSTITHEVCMDRSRMTRKPTTPGEILREEYLVPLEMSQKDLADHIEQDVKVINRIVNGRSAVTAEVALKLAATFRTTPEFWLNAQKAVDLWTARRTLRKLPKPLVRSVA